MSGRSKTGDERGRDPVWVAVGLGSNVGDRAANLRLGIDGLVELLTDLRHSNVYETQPVHVADQPLFLNACCTGRTLLTAQQLLKALQDLERSAGRWPGGERYGPRSLDLDLLLYGRDVISEPELIVPHPGLRDRAFVLSPLAELAPDWTVPASDGHAATQVGDLSRKVGSGGIVLTNMGLIPG